MKKILAIAMALLLVMGSLVFVSAASDATVTVATVAKESVKVGDTILIPVTISDYANAYASIIVGTPIYDSTKLTFDGYEASETGFADAFVEIGEDFGLMAIPTNAEAASKYVGGEICVLKFTAKEEITADSRISITVKEINGYTNGASDNWVAFKTLTSTVVSGGIDINTGDDNDDPTPGIFDTTITIATVNGPFAEGDEVAVPVTIGDWANAYATIAIELDYDETLLELDAIEPSDTDFGGALSSSNGNKFSLIAAPANDRAAQKVDGGEFCIAYFYALTDINEATTITLTADRKVTGYTNGSSDNWVASHELIAKVIDGGVAIGGGDDTCTHTGGEATCSAKAVCTLCGEEYGDFAADVHKNTEVRDESETYTGDTWCTDCETKIASGEVIGGGEEPGNYDATITITTIKDEIKAGDEVALPITITDWANAYATIAIELDYDETLLELDAIEASDTDFGGALSSTNGNKFSLIAAPQSDKAAQKVDGGEICIAYFYAIEDITETTTVTMTAKVGGYANGSADNWVATQELNVKVVDGGVYVEGTTPPPPPVTSDVTATIATLVQNVVAGAEVRIPVTVSKFEKGYGTIDLTDLTYDNTILEFVKIEASSTDFQIPGKIFLPAGETVSMIFAPTNANELAAITEGEICILVFEAKADITSDVAVSATITANGYIDDTYTDVEPIDVEVVAGGIAGHVHYGGEATCCTKAECDICGEEYGDFAADVHKNTEIRDDASADCGNDGYTGDTYCTDCGEKIADGEVIPATGAHTGGTATCCAKAECSVCGEEYGDFDADNHEGETELRYETNIYSGDLYCLGCGRMIEEGHAIGILGDADGDGTVTIMDAMVIAQYDVGLVDDINLAVSDVDGDGTVTIMDAMVIAQYDVGLLEKFPVEQ